MEMEPNQTPGGAKLTRLSALKRRRRLRRLRTAALALVMLAALALYASGIFGRGLALLSDMVESARIGLQPGGGWPVKTGIAEPLQVESLGGGFVELGNQDLVFFSARGAQLRSVAHNYARPCISSGKTRFVLYNRAGYELRVESRTRTLYTNTYTQPILLAEMASNGTVAVVTDSSRYLAEVTVYDSTFQPIYQWYPSDSEGVPGQIAFSQNGKRFAAACLSAANGQLAVKIHLLDLNSGTIGLTIDAGSSPVLQMHWLSNTKLLVVFQNRIAVFDTTTGEQLATYSYPSGTLLSVSVSQRAIGVLIGSEMADAPVRLILLDTNCQELGTASVPAPASKVVCTRSGAYVLRGDCVAAYDLEGEYLWEMSTDSQPQAVLNAKNLLVFSGGQAALVTQPAEE